MSEETKIRKKEYQRKRRLDPAYKERHRQYYAEWYKKNGRNRSGNYGEIILEWQQEHPGRMNVYNKVYRAVKNGRIIKPSKCNDCHQENRLLAHHEDYSKPLEVIWLCHSCHKIRHSK